MTKDYVRNNTKKTSANDHNFEIKVHMYAVSN